ncbi:MAG: GntR family transcriptional regulator [Bacteroidaceae bacterium]|nr:GntR family transcriptional regulator [Bacteroidaceae bacterium]
MIIYRNYRGDDVNILIDNKSGTPIYDQIYSQIKSQIISGALKQDELLPSIRGLAKDLRISFITTKRAYEELEKEGFIYTLPAKGCYVAPKNVELLREENLKKIEEHIDEVVRLAASCNLSKQEIIEMINFSLEEQG